MFKCSSKVKLLSLYSLMAFRLLIVLNNIGFFVVCLFFHNPVSSSYYSHSPTLFINFHWLWELILQRMFVIYRLFYYSLSCIVQFATWWQQCGINKIDKWELLPIKSSRCQMTIHTIVETWHDIGFTIYIIKSRSSSARYSLFGTYSLKDWKHLQWKIWTVRLPRCPATAELVARPVYH